MDLDDYYPITGEMFRNEENTEIYYLLFLLSSELLEELPSKHVVAEVGFIGKSNGEQKLNSFINELEDIILQENSKIKFSNIYGSRINEFKNKDEIKFLSANDISMDDYKVLPILHDEKTRDVLMNIKIRKEILRADIERKLSELKIDVSILDKMEMNKLIEKEFIILCKENSKPINRLSSRSPVKKSFKGIGFPAVGIECWIEQAEYVQWG